MANGAKHTRIKPDFLGIIPARYKSSRFPGKPLALIQGKPMFWHVYNQARQCAALKQIFLATDNEKIMDMARELGVPALMTSSEHCCGTDRVLEAACQLNAEATSVIVNIQGDEPAVAPEMIGELLSPFSDSEVEVSTLARKITDQEANDPNQVKVVFGHGDKALYFSRSKIPFYREEEKPVFWGHIGLYAFRMRTLKLFSRLEPSALEQVEKLEQLRLVEAGIPIHVVKTRYKSYGVDHPDDIIKIERIMREKQS